MGRCGLLGIVLALARHAQAHARDGSPAFRDGITAFLAAAMALAPRELAAGTFHRPHGTLALFLHRVVAGPAECCG